MRKQICNNPVYDRLPPLSASYPWLFAQNLEADDDTEDHIFYTVHDPLSHYRCRVPELLGRRIRACFHGWVVLSNHPHGVEWFLWNPITSNFIRLPHLVPKDGDSNEILHCYLTSPPNDPDSILLLTRKKKPNIVFCRLDHENLSWSEVSYLKQLRSIAGDHDCLLLQPTCCNGKVYAWTNRSDCVIQIDIVIKDTDVEINLMPFVSLPDPDPPTQPTGLKTCLKGSSSELFAIVVSFTGLKKQNPVNVYLYQLEMTNMVWVEMEDLKDTVFFVDMACDDSIACSPAIASEFGGYVHLLDETGKVIYSFNVKDKTIPLSSMHSLDLPPRSGVMRTSHISVWPMPQFRLQGDHGEVKCAVDSKQDEGKEADEIVVMNNEVEFNSKMNEGHLLNIPFHVLETIMEFCVGVEYLNLRATCKLCRLAAPVIRWSNDTRLQTYSLVSPWLMIFEKDRGTITFTDPMFGNKYFIKASPEFFYDSRILCSRYGWLLLFIGKKRVVFFNPFTSDIFELPRVSHLDSFCFSAPPTSPDCIVVGFSVSHSWQVYVHFVGRETYWRRFRLDFCDVETYSFGFPTFCGRDVYALFNEGGLQAFRGIDDYEFSWETVADEASRGCYGEYFHVKCDQHLLLVVVGEFGESVEVFKLNDFKWEKMDGLGRHAIYICGTTCVCMDAKTPEMENKIYFPRLHSENGKIVFYSLKTCRYHTFNGRNVEESYLKDLFRTKYHVYAHAWIEPTWQ